MSGTETAIPTVITLGLTIHTGDAGFIDLVCPACRSIITTVRLGESIPAAAITEHVREHNR